MKNSYKIFRYPNNWYYFGDLFMDIERAHKYSSPLNFHFESQAIDYARKILGDKKAKISFLIKNYV